MNTEELYNECHRRFNIVDGQLIYKVKPSERLNVGHIAGSKDKTTGYLRTRVGTKKYYVHRLIFLMSTHYMPKGIDHIDGDKTNNLMENLRDITQSQNCRNKKKRSGCTSKYRGVAFAKERNKWLASINLKGKSHHIGYFNDEVFAANAADVFNRKHHQRFATFNFPKENERSAI